MKKEKRYEFWKVMYKYIKDYRKKLIFAMLLSGLVGICVACQPLVIKYIVDDGILNESLSDNEKIWYVTKLCGLYLGLAIVRISMWRVGYKNMLTALEGSLFKLRSHFFNHVQNLCMRFYSTVSEGELFNCIMGSPITNIRTYMVQLFQSVPYQAVSLVISVVALFSFDWQLTAILLLIVIVMATINYFSRAKIRRISSEYIGTEAETSKYLSDALHGMDAIKIYSIENDTYKTFQGHIDKMYHKGIKSNMANLYEANKPEMIQFIGTAVIYVAGTYACIYRNLNVGTLYAFLSSMGSILGILIAWLNMGLQKSSAESGLEKIMKVLEQNSSTPEIGEHEKKDIRYEKSAARSLKKPCIEFRNVNFAYENKNILNNFSCKIDYNQSVALVGSSGSGKSTITKLVTRLYDVSDGEVLFHGNDVKEYDIHDLRVSFGVVPQNPFIFYGSIWDNIKIARPDASNKDVIDAMEIAYVHEFVNELEYGWNTIVGDGGVTLSGGQKQRIAIARAVLGNPDVLIFDEATSALDNISEKRIQSAMENLMKNHTLIIVAHRLSTIKNVDKVMVLKDGEVIEEGGYDELAKSGGAFSKLLEG